MRFSNWQISYKVLFVIFLLSMVTLAVGVIGYVDIERLDQATNDIEKSGNEALQGVRLNKAILLMNEAEFRLVAEPTEERLRDVEQSIADNRKQFEKQLAQLKQVAEPEQLRLISEVDRAFQAYLPQIADTVQRVKAGMADLAMSDARRNIVASADNSQTYAVKVEDALATLNNYASRRAEKISDAASAAAATTQIVMLVVVIGGVLGGCVTGYLVSTFTISRPLTRSVDSLSAIANGDLSVAIYGTGRKDEIGKVAAALEL
ncbi:MAG: MCP four helix bundle domain-containing protein, partial [Acetobacteraceae bacterium]